MQETIEDQEFLTRVVADFGAVDIKLGEVEFFTVEFPFANYAANDDGTEILYVRKLPTVTDSPLICLEPPAEVSSGGGAHEAILGEDILDLAGPIRGWVGAYVVGRKPSLS